MRTEIRRPRRSSYLSAGLILGLSLAVLAGCKVHTSSGGGGGAPIVADGSGTSEGSSSAPVAVAVGTPRASTIAADGVSYYSFTTTSAGPLTISLTNTDSDLNWYLQTSGGTQIDFCDNYYNGGAADEICSTVSLSASTTYRLQVVEWDGVANSFTLTIGGTAVGVLILDVASGGSVPLGGTVFYGVPVTATSTYVVSITGITGNPSLKVYSDSAFSTQYSCSNTFFSGDESEDCVVTATGSTLYISVDGSSTSASTYRLRTSLKATGAAANEGSTGTPIALTKGVPRASTVLGGGNSYYTVTGLSGTETVSITGQTAYGDLSVFSDSGFTTPVTCSNTDTGYSFTWPESCTVTGSTTLYIQVSAISIGGAFTLMVEP